MYYTEWFGKYGFTHLLLNSPLLIATVNIRGPSHSRAHVLAGSVSFPS